MSNLSVKSKVAITLKGFLKVKEQLELLKNNDRVEIVKEIAKARSWGDLSENAEYEAAKEKQAMIECKIISMASIIKDAEVIDPSTLSGDRIKFGATVRLLDEMNKEILYHLVGEYEADIAKNLLSYTSPLGQAIINKKVDDYVEVVVPKGNKIYKVISIEYV